MGGAIKKLISGGTIENQVRNKMKLKFNNLL